MATAMALRTSGRVIQPEHLRARGAVDARRLVEMRGNALHRGEDDDDRQRHHAPDVDDRDGDDGAGAVVEPDVVFEGQPERRENAVQQAGARLIDPKPDDGVDDAGQRPGQDHRGEQPLPPDLDLVDQRGGKNAEHGFGGDRQNDVDERVGPGRRRAGASDSIRL